MKIEQTRLSIQSLRDEELKQEYTQLREALEYTRMRHAEIESKMHQLERHAEVEDKFRATIDDDDFDSDDELTFYKQKRTESGAHEYAQYLGRRGTCASSDRCTVM